MSDAKKGKVNVLLSDIKEFKSKKVILPKVQEILKNDSENPLIKAVGDTKKHSLMELR